MIDPALARSWLMLSGRPRRDYPGSALASGADVVVVDLEDAVPAEEKPAALARAGRWLRDGGTGWLRIDAPGTAAWDAAAAALPGVRGLAGVVLAKAESVEGVARTVTAFRGVPVVPLIESAAGLLRVEEIAVLPGVLRIGFGTGDFCRDTGLAGTPAALSFARSRIAIASAAAGLAAPVDGGAAGDDPASLRAQASVAREHGFGGKFALREQQIPSLNEALSPSPEQIAGARTLLAGIGADDPGDGDTAPRAAIARRLLEHAAAYGLPGRCGAG